MRWSSGPARLGDGGQADDAALEAENGEGPAGHPCSRMSAEVCRLGRLLGGSSTFDRGCGPGGGGGGALRRGEDCVGLLAPIDPYGRRVLRGKAEGTVGR